MLSNQYFQTTDKHHNRIAKEPVTSNNLIYQQPLARMVARNHQEYIPKEREVIEVKIRTRNIMLLLPRKKMLPSKRLHLLKST